MPTQDDVYTIAEEEVLESLRHDLERRKGPRGRGRGDRPSSFRPDMPHSRNSRPLTAASLSLFLCGAGQIYNHQIQLGLLFLTTELLVVALNWCVVQTWDTLRELGNLLSFTPLHVVATVAVVDFLMMILALASIRQAYRYAERESGEFDGLTNPFLAGLTSFVIPGWGQIVNGQPGKALFFLMSLMTGLWVAGMVMFSPLLRLLEASPIHAPLARQLTPVAIAVLCAAGVMWLLSVYDAVLVSVHRRRMG